MEAAQGACSVESRSMKVGTQLSDWQACPLIDNVRRTMAERPWFCWFVPSMSMNPGNISFGA